MNYCINYVELVENDGRYSVKVNGPDKNFLVRELNKEIQWCSDYDDKTPGQILIEEINRVRPLVLSKIVITQHRQRRRRKGDDE